jgi:nicotinate phosphoribosyltransferase
MPSLGGVYKLAGVVENGKIIPKIKVSDNSAKITNPGFKTFYRIYDKTTGKAEADLIALVGEDIDFTKPLTLYHPIERWKKTTFTNYVARELPVCVIKNGKLVADMPKVKDIATYAKTEMDSFWDEYKRIDQPQIYKVDLSDGLYELKHDMLEKIRKGESLG